MDTGARITTILKDAGARAVLDIGCGHGALARRLAGEGLAVTGIDPAPDAIAAAQESVPEAQVSVAGAEALPFAPGQFDACVFLNSLHHVPVPLMEQALHEALRVLRPGGEVIVVEPLAEGPFFEVMRPVEDETAIRRAAMKAIDTVLAAGEATGPAPVTWLRATSVAGLEDFIDGLVRVDPARRAVAEAQRGTLARLLDRHARRAADGLALDQPLRMWRLRPG